MHIADVSYFLSEGSPLDGEARRRATSVYLVQKVIPMVRKLVKYRVRYMYNVYCLYGTEFACL